MQQLPNELIKKMKPTNKVGVQEYRHQIDHLVDVMHQHHYACVGAKEKSNNAKIAQRVGAALIDMYCPRAKQSDIDRAERIIDRSVDYINDNLIKGK